MKLSIYLNAQGDGFNVKNLGVFNPITAEEAATIHPVIKQVVTAKGQEQVIDALKALQKIAQKDTSNVTSYFFQNGQQVNNYDDYVITSTDGNQNIRFALMHLHTHYAGHNNIKGVAHRDNFEQMMNFVNGTDRTPEVLSFCTIS